MGHADLPSHPAVPLHAPVDDDKLADPPTAADLEVLARWMDSAFGVPGVGIRFGLDALLGLLPGVGDTATSLVSIYILTAAHRYGVPRIALLRMTLNIAVDLVIGAIPFFGDMFDVYWKANQRNVALARRHLTAAPPELRKLKLGDYAFVAMLIALILTVLAASVATAVMLIAWLAGVFRTLFV